MSVMRFVDSNILIYAVSASPQDEVKREIALALLEERDLVLSAQVLQEFYAQATRSSRSGALAHDQAVEFIESLLNFRILPITVELVREATDLCRRYRISYWDSAILAAARISGCDTLLTEDLNPGQDYDGVRAVNPFAPSGTRS